MLKGAVVKSGSSGNFLQFAKFLAVKHKKRLGLQAHREMRRIQEDIKKLQPKDTGASAGDTSGAKRDIYSSHPAFGLTIGNEIGDSGWQIDQNESAGTIKLRNPMWNKYLKYLEAGTARGHYNSGFVAKAWAKHLQRRTEKGYT
jgi:hypothetical protein